jgi:hypothetical protein
MGSFAKVVLQFSAAFWPRQQLTELTQLPRSNWTTLIYTDAYQPGKAKLDIATICGSSANSVETLSKDAIVADLMKAIRVAFPAAPDPIASKLTSWMGDPFSRGPYSFAGVGATPKDYQALATSVAGTLFFAGEHTNSTHMATAHGALASGQRAAGEVAALYQGKLSGACPVARSTGVASTSGSSPSNNADSSGSMPSDAPVAPTSIAVSGGQLISIRAANGAFRFPFAVFVWAVVAARALNVEF